LNLLELLKMLLKIKKIFKGKLIYVITILIIVSYVTFLYIFQKNAALSPSDFINNFTIFVGWIIALSIAEIHLIKTRRDNQLSKREEIKKSLEINAFREINKAASDFSSILTSLVTPYITLPSRLKIHIDKPLIFKFDKSEIAQSLHRQAGELYGGTANFIIVIESNEIAVVEFDHYRKYIQNRIDDVHKTIREFIDYFSNSSPSTLDKPEGYSEFERKCYRVSDELIKIQSYLFDYRIELMNTILGEVFGKKVPERVPKDPSYKTLKEVAVKELVIKECEERENQLLKTHKK